MYYRWGLMWLTEFFKAWERDTTMTRLELTPWLNRFEWPDGSLSYVFQNLSTSEFTADELWRLLVRNGFFKRNQTGIKKELDAIIFIDPGWPVVGLEPTMLFDREHVRLDVPPHLSDQRDWDSIALDVGNAVYLTATQV